MSLSAEEAQVLLTPIFLLTGAVQQLQDRLPLVAVAVLNQMDSL
jgi:hypothetical protein